VNRAIAVEKGFGESALRQRIHRQLGLGANRWEKGEGTQNRKKNSGGRGG